MRHFSYLRNGHQHESDIDTFYGAGYPDVLVEATSSILLFYFILSEDTVKCKKEQKVTKGDMIHDSYCWLGALPILSVSKTIDPSYKSYGATRPYKHGTAYLLFFLANSHSNQDDLNPAVVIGLIKENDL